MGSPGPDIFWPLPPDHSNFSPGQRRLQFDDDAARNFILKVDRRAALCIKLTGPEHATARRFRQSGCEPNLLAKCSHTASEYVSNAELLCDHGYRYIRISKFE